MDIRRRNNVTVVGRADAPVLLLAHGFGCDQSMWRLVVPALTERYRVVLFDYVGSGRADPSAWDEGRYSSLEGYALDVLEVCEELDLRDVAFVGHSVSAMDGSARGGEGTAPRLPSGDGRAVAALHRRGRLPGRVQRPGHRRTAGVPGGELPGLVGGDGPGHHGRRRPAGTRPGADQLVLRHRPGHGPRLRPYDVLVGQPRGPQDGDGTDADPGVQAGRDRSARGRCLRS
ncbi:alpha/beta fold hydrolase [Streptomyces bauhiniae]